MLLCSSHLTLSIHTLASVTYFNLLSDYVSVRPVRVYQVDEVALELGTFRLFSKLYLGLSCSKRGATIQGFLRVVSDLTVDQGSQQLDALLDLALHDEQHLHC